MAEAYTYEMFPDFSRQEAQVSKRLTPDEIKAQLEFLNILVASGQFVLITSDLFPNVPPPWLSMARFFACNNLVNNLIEARAVTPHEDLQVELGGLITGLIKERDSAFSAQIKKWGGDDENEQLLQAQAHFRQTPDQNTSLQLAISLGLSEQITDRNFPALAAVSADEILRLRARALRIKIDDLRDQWNSLKSNIGLQEVSEESELRKKLSVAISKLETQRAELLNLFISLSEDVEKTTKENK